MSQLIYTSVRHSSNTLYRLLSSLGRHSRRISLSLYGNRFLNIDSRIFVSVVFVRYVSYHGTVHLCPCFTGLSVTLLRTPVLGHLPRLNLVRDLPYPVPLLGHLPRLNLLRDLPYPVPTATGTPKDSPL